LIEYIYIYIYIYMQINYLIMIDQLSGREWTIYICKVGVIEDLSWIDDDARAHLGGG